MCRPTYTVGKVSLYTGWIIKTSHIFCLRKYARSQLRQNCFGSWILSSIHSSCQRNSAVQTVLYPCSGQSTVCTVAYLINCNNNSIPILEKAAGMRSWSGKIYVFLLIHRKQTLTKTVTLICWRLPYCLNVVDFIRAITPSSCKTVLRHTTQMWRNSLRHIQIECLCGHVYVCYSVL